MDSDPLTPGQSDVLLLKGMLNYWLHDLGGQVSDTHFEKFFSI